MIVPSNEIAALLSYVFLLVRLFIFVHVISLDRNENWYWSELRAGCVAHSVHKNNVGLAIVMSVINFVCQIPNFRCMQ